jgi:hypothetical protein
VESEHGWFEKIKAVLPANVDYRFAVTEADYIAAIGDADFDVIVIDGSFRLACARIAFPHLKRGGLIVFDNTDWHPKCAELLGANQELIRADFGGFGPQLARSWVTSIYFRRDFDIPFLRLPHFPPGGHFVNSD